MQVSGDDVMKNMKEIEGKLVEKITNKIKMSKEFSTISDFNMNVD